MRPLWLLAGLVLTGLAVLGALLPVMPSTVFALGAAACFARSSPALEGRLLDHPVLGPSVRAWRTERAIPRPARLAALASMAGSALFVALTAPSAVAWGAGVVLAGSALYVGTRPEPSSDRPIRPRPATGPAWSPSRLKARQKAASVP